MDDEDMNLLYDNHYDVKVFLQRQTSAAPNETDLQPADTTDVNVTTDSVDGANYKTDPIHFNSDKCCNFEGFEKLINGHYFDVDLA